MQFCALSVALAVDDCASHSQLSITEWAVGVRSIFIMKEFTTVSKIQNQLRD